MQHHSAGRLFEAEGIYQQILQADPNQPDALHLLGLIAYQFGKNDTAADLIDQALATRPDYAEAYSNRGLALQELNQLEDAVASYDKAIGIKPDYAEAYWNKSLALLLCGKFGNGWELYKWRWRCTEIHPLPRDFTQPLWEGGSLDGKTVLVWGEQGVGDEAMFASLIPEIIEQAEHCVIECDPRLVELFNRSFPEATAIARAVPHSERADAPDIDLQAPIADLARWLRPTLESFAPVTSCLIAYPTRVAECRSRYQHHGRPLVVGISWRSGNREFGLARSTTLDLWAPLFRQPGVRFVNLQYGDCAADLATVRQRLGIEILHDDAIDPLSDMDGFAAQVAAMDLVVSIDNSTVHLAGALGKPTWVLLPYVPDWRWLLDRDDSPWYGSVKLYRQCEDRNWEPVLQRVAQDMVNLTQ